MFNFFKPKKARTKYVIASEVASLIDLVISKTDFDSFQNGFIVLSEDMTVSFRQSKSAARTSDKVWVKVSELDGLSALQLAHEMGESSMMHMFTDQVAYAAVRTLSLNATFDSLPSS